MSGIVLYEELMFIDKSEDDISGAWKGAHLLLFFLAFVFGSFCTLCFHLLMYMFDEKCVLFPKLLSIKSMRHNVIYEFTPSDKDLFDMPVDFVSTQWVGRSMCALPTYVPLMSGIFGLVWTTIFLMCSTGSRTLTGLQRPWRVLLPVFIFSLLMGCVCCYTSTVTHAGLHELCLKLGEITGSTTCTYTVNLATLVYERRIRGVYQAIKLTIITAWLHTSCWLLSALLVLARVFLAVDFQLVKVKAELHGNIDQMLGRHEVHLRTVLPETIANASDSDFRNKAAELSVSTLYHASPRPSQYSVAFPTKLTDPVSETLPLKATLPEEEQFIADDINNLFDNLPLSENEERAKHINEAINKLWEMFNMELTDRGHLSELYRATSATSTLELAEYISMHKHMNLSEVDSDGTLLEPNLAADALLNRKVGKSNLKNTGVQTKDKLPTNKQHVQISERNTSPSSDSNRVGSVDKETQTREKEKMD